MQQSQTGRIQDWDVARLQSLVTRYPWFSYAREVLLYKLVEMEPECLEGRYREDLVFFPRRDEVLLRCRALASQRKEEGEQVQVDMLLDAEEELELLPDIEIVGSEKGEDSLFEVETSESGATVVEVEENYPIEREKPRIVVVGGDYFSKEDFAQLEESQEATDIRFGAPACNDGDLQEPVQQQVETDFNSMDFVTETLAAIYADQGYYDKAIEVYAKLILLYPEKSAYFATLVNEIKSKN